MYPDVPMILYSSEVIGAEKLNVRPKDTCHDSLSHTVIGWEKSLMFPSSSVAWVTTPGTNIVVCHDGFIRDWSSWPQEERTHD